MADQSQLDALVAELQQQRDTADREALRQRLLREGAPPNLVDLAFAEVFGVEARQQPAVSAPAAEAEYLTRIRDYLQQHRDTYEQAALRQKLLADGHPAQLVDLAIAQVYGLQVPPSPAVKPTRTISRPLALGLLGIIAINYIAAPLLAFALLNANVGQPTWWIMAVLPLELVVAIGLWQRYRDVSRGIAWGLVATLPIVAAALLVGWCISLIS